MRRASRPLIQRILIGSLAAALGPLLLAGAFFLYSLTASLTESDTQELVTYASQMAYLLRDKAWTPEALPAAPPDQLGPEALLVDRQGLNSLATRYTAGGVVLRVPAEAITRVLAGQVVTIPSVRPLSHSGTLVMVPIRRGGDVDGAVVAWMHVGEQTSANRAIARTFTLAAILSLALAAIVGWRLYSSLAMPLRRLSQLARRIATGDFSQRAAPGAPAEVAELGGAFNYMAEELDRQERVRRDLIANVSHELKSPLARIAGYVAAVQDGLGGERARDGYLQMAQQETLRLSRLVDDLLDFARLESGRLKLHRVACDLMPVLERTVASFRSQAEAVGVELAGPGSEPLPLVDCDPERVVQVLHNLLTNALGVTRAGGSVSISAAPAGGSVEVAVTDTGPGVPPEEQAAIWERFYKIDKVRTPGAEAGHGLGLAIVKQLVELHGGQAGVASDGKNGSRFWFRLPAARPPAG